MKRFLSKFKPAVATLLICVSVGSVLSAEDEGSPGLLQALREAGPDEGARLAERIRNEWAKSGSASMDLLLRRGREAIEAGDLDKAVEHLTALTDHAPGFAEGWAARAMAFYRQEEFGLALADLEQALALNPDHFGAIQGLGAIMERLERPHLAWRAYEKVLALHPHHPQVLSAMERLEREVRGRDL